MRSQAGSCLAKQGSCLGSSQRRGEARQSLRHQEAEVPGKEPSIRAEGRASCKAIT